MKQNLQRLCLLCAALLCAAGNHAQTLIDGIYYNLDAENLTAEVAYYENESIDYTYYKGDLKIPLPSTTRGTHTG